MGLASPLDRHEFVAGKSSITAHSTPYGKYLSYFESSILPGLEKSAKDYAEEHNVKINDPKNIDGRYYIEINKALYNARIGKDYTEVMRLLIPATNFRNYSTDNMIYKDTPTPEEAKRVFMEMGMLQFPEFKTMSQRDLEQFVIVEYPKVTNFKNEAMIKALNPNNMNDELKLEKLKEETPLYCDAQIDTVVYTTKGGNDIKVLYAMKLLEEKLQKKIDQSNNSKEINELKEKL